MIGDLLKESEFWQDISIGLSVLIFSIGVGCVIGAVVILVRCLFRGGK